VTRPSAPAPVAPDGHDREGGFTLIELMMVAAILGIVAVAITSGLIVGMRTFAGTDNKVVSSTDAQFVSVYLPADLQSVGEEPGSVTADPGHTSSPGGVNFAAAVIPGDDCVPGNSGTDTNILKLRWTDALGDKAAVYRVVNHNGEWQMLRYVCNIDEAGTATQIATMRVARNLNGNSSGDEQVTVEDPQVTLALTSKARKPGDPTNFTYEITGTRRTWNP
jgi:prepilin-type N-terminal cleavage/methylation domain-containing protein